VLFLKDTQSALALPRTFFAIASWSFGGELSWSSCACGAEVPSPGEA
jgi:hypothetical protein